MAELTNDQVYESIAQGLREFGYPDVAASMIGDTHRAMKANEKLPYGVIGMFAERLIKEHAEAGLLQ